MTEPLNVFQASLITYQGALLHYILHCVRLQQDCRAFQMRCWQRRPLQRAPQAAHSSNGWSRATLGVQSPTASDQNTSPNSRPHGKASPGSQKPCPAIRRVPSVASPETQRPVRRLGRRSQLPFKRRAVQRGAEQRAAHWPWRAAQTVGCCRSCASTANS